MFSSVLLRGRMQSPAPCKESTTENAFVMYRVAPDIKERNVDCRTVSRPPVFALKRLFTVGGDLKEGFPGLPLPPKGSNVLPN